MIEPLQFRMYLCTLNMKIYMIIYVWNMKMVWGYCFDKQLLKWYESVLAGLTLSCYALCLQVQKSVCVCVWLVCLFLSRRPAACPQTLTFSLQLQCRKKVKFKSASRQFHPITAWWRVTPSPKAGIIPLICIHMWLAGTPSLPCCQYTHHLVLLQHL